MFEDLDAVRSIGCVSMSGMSHGFASSELRLKHFVQSGA